MTAMFKKAVKAGITAWLRDSPEICTITPKQMGNHICGGFLATFAEPDDETIDAVALAIFRREMNWRGHWAEVHEGTRNEYRSFARDAIVALSKLGQ